MKLDDAREAYYSYTGLASSVSRQISFAGIAIIWIFKNEQMGQLSLPNGLMYPAISLLLSLIFDLLQYVYSSAAWGIFHRLKEKSKGINFKGDIETPCYINWPSNLFFWAKITSLIVGYIFLITYASKIIVFQ